MNAVTYLEHTTDGASSVQYYDGSGQLRTREPRWAPVDDDTADLLSVLAADWRPFAEDDRNLIANAIRDDAVSHDGHIDPNRVRRALDGRVKPQRVGVTYRALRLSGHITPDGYGTNDDTSGNAGKPQLKYRWTG